MALKRAVEISQGRGLSGMPVFGHVQCSGESLMHGFFGEIEIAKESHQRGQNPARFGPVNRLNDSAQEFGSVRRHLRQASKRNELTQPPEHALIALAFLRYSL